MSEKILITGATGLVGSQLVRTILERKQDSQIYLLIRGKSFSEAQQKVEGLFDESSRVRILPGTVSHENLGWEEAVLQSMRENLTEIYHVAAYTKFPSVSDELENTNVRGTNHLVRFARNCPKLRRFHHVSTTFVSGSRTGLILESQLDEGQSFSNPYEKSKLNGELIFSEGEGRDIPYTIYRPSVVVGHSITGETPHFRGMYQILKASWVDLLRIVPGARNYSLDVVPVDFVVDALLSIGESSQSESRTFHLTAGPERRMEIGPMFDAWVNRAAFHGFKISQPVFSTPDQLMSQGISTRRSAKLLEHLIPYLNIGSEFDRRETDLLLSGSGIKTPSLKDYYETLIDFAIDKRFGTDRAPAHLGSNTSTAQS